MTMHPEESIMSDTAEKDDQRKESKPEETLINQRTIDLLVANIIPTTKYFESRFDFMQHQINELREGQKQIQDTMNLRFEQVDKRFEKIDAEIRDFKTTVDKRFEQVDAEIRDFKIAVDKRFEQVNAEIRDFKIAVDKRFEQVEKRFERIDAEIRDFKAAVDKRFEQVDKKFEQVDKRFEQIEKRLDQIVASIDRLADKLDQRDERQRNFTIKMFSIAISISFLGVLGVLLKIVGVI
jgi:methyl-accepting chemotaxis protein